MRLISVLTSSLISLLQGPASVSGQIWKVPAAGTLRMTLSPAVHAAVHASAKALGKETRRRWSARIGGEGIGLAVAALREYLGVVRDAVADGAEVVEREEDAGLGGVRQESRGEGGREQKQHGPPRHRRTERRHK